jgi:hypothetical protein
MKRDGFPHPASSKDADCFTRKNIKADVVEHDVVSESFRDVAELDVGREFGIVGHRQVKQEVQSVYSAPRLIESGHNNASSFPRETV